MDRAAVRAFLAVLVFAAVYTGVNLYRLAHFYPLEWDLAIFSQGVHKLAALETLTFGRDADVEVDAPLLCADDDECDDGLFCNGVETCAAGDCQPGTAVECNDGQSCTVDSCDESADSCLHAPNDGACDDGLYCNGVEICDALTGCLAGSGDPCDDAVACTIDTCDESTPPSPCKRASCGVPA